MQNCGKYDPKYATSNQRNYILYLWTGKHSQSGIFCFEILVLKVEIWGWKDCLSLVPVSTNKLQLRIIPRLSKRMQMKPLIGFVFRVYSCTKMIVWSCIWRQKLSKFDKLRFSKRTSYLKSTLHVFSGQNYHTKTNILYAYIQFVFFVERDILKVHSMYVVGKIPWCICTMQAISLYGDSYYKKMKTHTPYHWNSG